MPLSMSFDERSVTESGIYHSRYALDTTLGGVNSAIVVSDFIIFYETENGTIYGEGRDVVGESMNLVLSVAGTAITGFWVEMSTTKEVIDRGTVDFQKVLELDVLIGEWHGIDERSRAIKGSWNLLKLAPKSEESDISKRSTH